MRRFLILSVIVSLVTAVVPPSTAHAASPPQPVTVRILASDGTERSSFSILTANTAGGMSVAVADLGSDGLPEIILGNGLGNEPRVHVLREDGSEVGSFLAYAPTMGLGVNVGVCDIDGDGDKEIVTSPQRGGGPHVRIFDNYGNLFDAGFFAYDQSMREGVNVACGDLDGDGAAEIVTFPAAGGEPRVRVWTRNHDVGAMELMEEFLAFDEDDRRGLVGAVHEGTLSVANQRGAEVERKTYVIHSPATIVSSETLTTGGRGTVSMFEHDDALAIATSQGAEIVTASKLTIAVTSSTGSAAAAAADFDRDGTEEIVTVESRAWFGEENQAGRRIVVDLSEQRLYAYENGLLSNSFLVSTARPPFRTPIGEHTVLAKVPLVHYAGGSGADAYDLGWIPYNLRFYPHIYIHYAPWHNNFGYVISHGCVNVALENIKWIYDWAEEGDAVIVQE